MEVGSTSNGLINNRGGVFALKLSITDKSIVLLGCNIIFKVQIVLHNQLFFKL